MRQNNIKLEKLSEKEMQQLKGGFLGILSWGITLWSVSQYVKNRGTFDSGSMSEEEYAVWVEGLTGAPYDWGDAYQ